MKTLIRFIIFTLFILTMLYGGCGYAESEVEVDNNFQDGNNTWNLPPPLTQIHDTHKTYLIHEPTIVKIMVFDIHTGEVFYKYGYVMELPTTINI